MFKKLPFFLIGLVLLPLCAAVSLTARDTFLSMGIEGTENLSMSARWFIGGVVFWAILYLMLPRPMKTYVLAHELSHAVWAWAFGAKVWGLKVTDKGGHVKMDRTNFLITLAPYFFPFYTVCAIVLHLVLSLFYDLQAYEPFVMAVLGVTWCFHLTFTVSALRVIQPDIQEHGRLFSYSVIYLLNIIGVCLYVIAVGNPTLEAFFQHLLENLTMVRDWISSISGELFQALDK